MRTALLRAACALALFCAAPAFGADAPKAVTLSVTAPDWTVGSTWYYSDGYALKVTASRPGNTQFDRLDAPGQWFTRQGFLRKDLISGTATRNTIFRTVPDGAGVTLTSATPLTFQREYLSNGKLMVHASSWSVEGRETITVPAGTFDCWIIVWRSRSLKSDWTGFERWWYSPVAQNYVRMEYKYGTDGEGSRVLMRYQLGNASPVLAPLAAPVIAPPPQGKVQSAELAAPIPAPPAPVPAQKAAPVKPAAPKPALLQGAPSPRFWHVQIAAAQDKVRIEASLSHLLQQPALSHLPAGVYAVSLPGRPAFYRAWLGRFTEEKGARVLCRQLVKAGSACTVVKPGAAVRSQDAKNTASKNGNKAG